MPQAPRTPPSDTQSAPQRVTLARIARPRGIRGEVIADLLTDFPERLTELKRVFLAASSGRPVEREMRIRRCSLHQGRAVFHFEGVDTVEAAEKLRGCEVQVPFSERIALPAGKYFVSDLAGCEVYELSEGKEVVVGVIRDLSTDTGTPLLVVDSSRGELLIPFAEDICRRIDVAGRRIEVVLPEGLLDLN